MMYQTYEFSGLPYQLHPPMCRMDWMDRNDFVLSEDRDTICSLSDVSELSYGQFKWHVADVEARLINHVGFGPLDVQNLKQVFLF